MTDNHEDRASRFQAYAVPATYEIERAQLDQALELAIMTQEQYDKAVAALDKAYNRNAPVGS